MNPLIKSSVLCATAFAALLLMGSALAAGPRTVTDPERPRALPEEGAVAVSWGDPAEFTELRFSGNRWEAQRGNWVFELAQHLRKTLEKHLPEGERMEVEITDIDRAGRYEPGLGVRMDSVRIMRNIDSPSMRLSFRRFDADGQLLDEGERKLRDMMYLTNVNVLSNTDPLRYEKRMIDDWARREFRVGQTASR